jgi:hypothetical protein
MMQKRRSGNRRKSSPRFGMATDPNLELWVRLRVVHPPGPVHASIT